MRACINTRSDTMLALPFTGSMRLIVPARSVKETLQSCYASHLVLFGHSLLCSTSIPQLERTRPQSVLDVKVMRLFSLHCETKKRS